jgi:radical SAM superfamily enzyme YgiQ (UPF0313 family)
MRMRVLFINPSQEHFISAQQGWSFGLRDVGYYQPLGVLYVATHLQQALPQCTVQVIDAASPDMPYDELRGRIRAFAPDVLGISTYTHTFVDALTICRITREEAPGAHITLGGHHLTYYARETLTHDCVDSVVIGEGEEKCTELVRALMTGTDVEAVCGVFTRKNLDAIADFPPDKRFVADIARLPVPDRSLVAAHAYYNMLTVGRKMTTIISSRGCPYKCTFCPQGREPYRPRSAKDVADEIEACLKQGYTDFFFAEDTFNINAAKVIALCDEILARGLKVRWCCKARIHGMTREALARMAQAGCYLINFGVETGSDEGLAILQKGTTTAEIRQVFQWTREVGIQSMAYFMIGHPFEKTARDVMRHVRFLLSLGATYCNINSVNPVPFTPLFDEGVAKGICDYGPWFRLVLHGEMFSPCNWEEHLSHARLQRLRSLALFLFYFRPAYIARQLMAVESPAQLVYKARVACNMLVGLFRGK